VGKQDVNLQSIQFKPERYDRKDYDSFRDEMLTLTEDVKPKNQDSSRRPNPSDLENMRKRMNNSAMLTASPQ